MTERKTIRVELKDDEGGEPGSFRAVFSRLNVLDHDGDVTLPGAFPAGKSVPISAYGHRSWEGELPVGKGTIGEDAETAFVDGQLFLDTEGGRETHAVLKGLGELAEFSYGYDVLDHDMGTFGDGEDAVDARLLKGLDVFEVSPVLRGAGIETGLVSIKATGQPLAEQGEAALAVVTAFGERLSSLAELRAKEGRELSETNRGRILDLVTGLGDVAAKLLTLLPPAEPAEPDKGAAIRAQAIRAQAESARLRAGGPASE